MSENKDFRFLHPSRWKAAKGYSNGVVAEGRVVYLGGQIGWNAEQQFETDDFAGQCRQAFANIIELLNEAGLDATSLVRLTWYVTDKQAYLDSLHEIGQAYREHIGKHYPAMTLVQVMALVEDRAQVEIEATAVDTRSG